jgi:hypothetical protein
LKADKKITLPKFMTDTQNSELTTITLEIEQYLRDRGFDFKDKDYKVITDSLTHAYSIGFETCKELAERIMNDDVDNIKFEHHAPTEKLSTSGGS